MKLPAEGSMAGFKHTEYCRDWDGTADERVIRSKGNDGSEGLSAHWTSSSSDRLASFPP